MQEGRRLFICIQNNILKNLRISRKFGPWGFIGGIGVPGGPPFRTATANFSSTNLENTRLSDVVISSKFRTILNLEHLYIIEVLIDGNATIMFKDYRCSFQCNPNGFYKMSLLYLALI